MKFKKKWIRMNEVTQQNEDPEVISEAEEKEEKDEMGFFSKHKKGLIFGGLGTIAAAVAGVLILKNRSDDDYEDYEDDDDFDDAEEDPGAEESAE